MSTSNDRLYSIIQIRGGTTLPDELYPRELFVESDGLVHVGNPVASDASEPTTTKLIKAGSAKLLIGENTKLYGTELPSSGTEGQVFFLVEE